MNHTIEIPDDVASALRAGADKKGVPFDQFVVEALKIIVRDEMSMNDSADRAKNTKTAKIRKFHELLETLRNPNLPSIPPEAWSREHIYEDRGL